MNIAYSFRVLFSLILALFLVYSSSLFALAQSPSSQNTTDVLIQFAGPVGVGDRALIRGLGGVIHHEYSLVPAISAKYRR
jgi:hypothetical protein